MYLIKAKVCLDLWCSPDVSVVCQGHETKGTLHIVAQNDSVCHLVDSCDQSNQCTFASACGNIKKFKSISTQM